MPNMVEKERLKASLAKVTKDKGKALVDVLGAQGEKGGRRGMKGWNFTSRIRTLPKFIAVRREREGHGDFDPRPLPQRCSFWALTGGTSANAVTTIPPTSPSIVDLVQAYQITDKAAFEDAAAATAILSTLMQSACSAIPVDGGSRKKEEEVTKMKERVKRKEEKIAKLKESLKKVEGEVQGLKTGKVTVEATAKTERNRAEGLQKSLEEQKKAFDDQKEAFKTQKAAFETQKEALTKLNADFESYKADFERKLTEWEAQAAVYFRDDG